MGYHDSDDVYTQAPDAPPSMMHTALSVGVRAVGMAVLLVGLWAGVKIILEAWALYEEPQRIQRFADAIQQGSNLDGVLESLTAVPGGTDAGAARSGGQGKAGSPADGLRLSYFAAWFIGLLLMFVIGALAMAAITTGGQLALYDLQVKHHSRAVIKEVRRLRRAA